jgi:hypothetical protein
MRKPRKLAQNIWYQVRSAAAHLSRVAGFLSNALNGSGAVLVGGDASFQRGGFYAAAPWHGIKATPSMVRARLLVGGDASFQRGGFYAAAPWHIFQATPSPVRAQCWAGGGASIPRGGFYAAAPWRGV